MNLTQLKFAQAVSETASFTLAADRCCVTQPTLSNGIAQLEQELGGRLFARTTRKVALTPFGAHVLPYLAEVLRAQETLALQAQAFLEPARQLIRIGTSPLMRASLLSRMIEPFKAQRPTMDVVLREMNMADLYRMLADGKLDVVMGVAGALKGPWTSVPLYSELLQYLPRGAARPAKAHAAAVEFSEIARETYVMVPDACGLARATRDLFRSHRRKLIAYSGEAMSYQVLEEWAALGVGAAILPTSKIMARDRPSYPIVDKRGQAAMIHFEATWTPEGARAAHIREFAAHLQAVVPRIVAGLKEASASAR
jgi:DNA-binding transcriptional LysR family regulator